MWPTCAPSAPAASATSTRSLTMNGTSAARQTAFKLRASSSSSSVVAVLARSWTAVTPPRSAAATILASVRAAPDQRRRASTGAGRRAAIGIQVDIARGVWQNRVLVGRGVVGSADKTRSAELSVTIASERGTKIKMYAVLGRRVPGPNLQSTPGADTARAAWEAFGGVTAASGGLAAARRAFARSRCAGRARPSAGAPGGLCRTHGRTAGPGDHPAAEQQRASSKHEVAALRSEVERPRRQGGARPGRELEAPTVPRSLEPHRPNRWRWGRWRWRGRCRGRGRRPERQRGGQLRRRRWWRQAVAASELGQPAVAARELARQCRASPSTSDEPTALGGRARQRAVAVPPSPSRSCQR